MSKVNCARKKDVEKYKSRQDVQNILIIKDKYCMEVQSLILDNFD